MARLSYTSVRCIPETSNGSHGDFHGEGTQVNGLRLSLVPEIPDSISPGPGFERLPAKVTA
jgi:hypothetical protein